MAKCQSIFALASLFFLPYFFCSMCKIVSAVLNYCLLMRFAFAPIIPSTSDNFPHLTTSNSSNLKVGHLNIKRFQISGFSKLSSCFVQASLMGFFLFAHVISLGAGTVFCSLSSSQPLTTCLSQCGIQKILNEECLGG